MKSKTILANPAQPYFEGTRRPRCQAAVKAPRVKGQPVKWRQCANPAQHDGHRAASGIPFCGTHAQTDRLEAVLQFAPSEADQ